MSDSQPELTTQIDGLSLSASTARGPISRLPPELILRTLELAVEGDSNPRLPNYRRTLRTTSRVCKAWTGPSQLLLLKEVYTDLNGDGLLAAIDRRAQWTCEQLVIEGAHAPDTFDILRRAQSVRKLHLLNLTMAEDWSAIFQLEPVQNLVSLAVDGVQQMITWTCSPPLLTNLRKLRLNFSNHFPIGFGEDKRDLARIGQLLAAPKLEHLSFALTSEFDAESIVFALDLVKPTQIRSLSIAHGGLFEGVAASEIINKLPTITSLALESEEPLFHDTLLTRLDPELKLKRLVLNLRTSLWHSNGSIERWLTLPQLAEVKVLVIRGRRWRKWRDTNGGAELMDAAKAKGIPEVYLRGK